MKVYRIWNKSFGNRRFIDTWGISRDELGVLRDVELVIGPSCIGYYSMMLQASSQHSIVEQLKAHGAISLEQYKSNLE